MRTRTRSMSVLALLAVAMLGSGCGKPGEKPVAPAPGAGAAAVDISLLPEFLRYPGATATERMEISVEDSKGTSWLLVSTDPPDKVSEWYVTSVEKNGWVKDPAGGKVGMLEWVNAGNTETLKMLIFEQDGRTSISFTQALK